MTAQATTTGAPADETAAEDRPASVDIRIEQDIAAAIFEQRMPPGTRLSEARLGQLYEVSRTVVRKALFRLASDRLVEIRPNRGAIVPRPDVTEARNVFAARRVIEPALLADSVPHLAAADRRTLDALVVADRRAHEARDRQAMIRASGDFHRGLARMAGNDVLFEFLEQLIGRTSLIIATYQTYVLPHCAEHVHEALVETIASGDVAAAQQAMIRHLLDCEAQLHLQDDDTETDDLAGMLDAHATDTAAPAFTDTRNAR
ncbi:GntR family transcriptional regulator [Salinisphaera sp. Q1T1-3]|uniref:GntR family transcriptional regulator n=1 Tax=Salinisphaera sp. Q1T1-3 TaxID=2321229 RepID=UPI000E7600C1|nr:GntR family transcriptional regulator [Salinisphaera sp. Q1T1-3]RJS91735.1 GntR family transcriptional regulator [Salinisphaera sp. Q1T1-3]